MTNEQLVMQIQAGEECFYSELWERVRRFIYQQAFSYSRFFPDSTLELDDLAQGGFLALVDAVNSYDPDAGGNLLTVLRYHLRKTWRTMYGLRGTQDALDRAVSLDEPIDDEGETPLLDTVPDPAAQEAFEEREETLYRSELRQYLDDALSRAPHGGIVRLRYFEGQTGQEIAAELGKSVSRVYQQEHKCLRWLRAGPCTRELQEFNYYKGVGLQSFKENGSIQERYLLKHEAWRPMRGRQ